MNCRNHSLTFLSMCLLATSAFMSGCTTTGLDRSVNTSNSIQDVDKEIRTMIVQIDATSTSLDRVVQAEEPKLKKTFDKYSDNLKDLTKEGNKTLKRVDELKENRKEYFSEWKKQGDDYTNPEIRALSEERRIKLAAIYDRVPVAAAGVKGAYIAYITDLTEIQLFLSNDLTPKGVEAIAPVVAKATVNKDDLLSSLQPLMIALDEIKAELYSGKK